MNILLATPIYPPEIGGPATYTKELVERLGDEHNITVIAYTTRNPKHINGAKLIFVDKTKPLFYRIFRFFLAVLKYAKEADIIYVQNAVAAGLPAVLAGKIRKRPVVLKFVGDEAWERTYSSNKTKKLLVEHLENPDGTVKTKIFRAIQQFVLKRVDVLTTPSKYLGEKIVKSYKLDPSKFIVNYNAEKLNHSKEIVPIHPKKHQIMTSARLVSWKGVDGVIQAVNILKRDIPDIHFVVAGDGPETNNLKRLVRDLDLEKNVTFLGRVPRAQTAHLRKESEIYILNSLYEGLPHTVLSSFSAKIPVIATDIPGTNEAVYDKKTGILVPPNNPDKLAESIKELFSNKDLQETLVKNAYDLLQTKFSWDSHTRKLLEIFQAVNSKPID